MIDWPETRLRLHLWLHHAWPFRVIAWLRSRGVPESEDFGKFGDSEFEPLTPEQYAVLANAEPRERGKVKAGTLRPLTPAQHDVMAQAAPLERGRIISSIVGTMHESEDSSQLSALQNAVQEGLADSEAGKYTVVNSSEALAAHLKSLRSSQEQKK